MHIYIFGAGKRGRELLSCLRKTLAGNYSSNVNALEYLLREKCNASPTKCEFFFLDNDINKQGAKIDDVFVLSLKEGLKYYSTEDMVISSVLSYIPELKNMGYVNVFPRTAFTNHFPILHKKIDYMYNAAPFNRYDSPYQDVVFMLDNEEQIWGGGKDRIKGIAFNLSRQIALLNEFSLYSLPCWNKHKTSKFRYYTDNGMFGLGSASALCFFMRKLKPQRIIEIGSGFSTAVMLDTNEKYLDSQTNICCIEPDADRLRSILCPADNIELHENIVQKEPLTFFESLDKNDILFIDSSHTARPGGDVNYEIFEILPRLKSGVYIHFHDIQWPFEYCKEWRYKGICYNEIYLLRAFLMNNDRYKIQLFGDMLSQLGTNGINQEWFRSCGCVGSGSLWLKKE